MNPQKTLTLYKTLILPIRQEHLSREADYTVELVCLIHQQTKKYYAIQLVSLRVN